MKKFDNIVTDEELEEVALKYVPKSKISKERRRNMLDLGVLSCAAGFYQSLTSKSICKDLGLIKTGYSLTKKGRDYLYAAFCKDSGGPTF